MENNILIPNSTQIPNFLLDFLFPRIPEAEMKCLLYICRRTYGFHKDEDRISYSQFINGLKTRDGKILDKGTGLARGTVAAGLRSLVAANAISVEKNNKGNIYRINLGMDFVEVVRKIDQYRKETTSSTKNRPKQVRLLHLQKKGKQRETKYYDNLKIETKPTRTADILEKLRKDLENKGILKKKAKS